MTDSSRAEARAQTARLSPAAARCSRNVRLAAMRANSAATKKALMARSSTAAIRGTVSWRRLVEILAIIVTGQLQPGDAPSLHAEHLHAPVLVVQCGAGLRDEAEPVEHEAGDRLVLTLRSGEAGRFGDLVEMQRSVDGPGAGAERHHGGWRGRSRTVELVVDLTHQLLDDVLEGDDAV